MPAMNFYELTRDAFEGIIAFIAEEYAGEVYDGRDVKFQRNPYNYDEVAIRVLNKVSGDPQFDLLVDLKNPGNPEEVEFASWPPTLTERLFVKVSV